MNYISLGLLENETLIKTLKHASKLCPTAISRFTQIRMSQTNIWWDPNQHAAFWFSV